MTDRYDEMSVVPDPSLAEALRQRLHAHLAGVSPDDLEGRFDLYFDAGRIDSEDRLVEMKEWYMPVQSPTKDGRSRWRIPAAVVAVVAVIGVAGIALANNDNGPAVDEVPSPPPASSPEEQEAIGLAQRFVEARDAYDGEAVRALVTDDAVIDDFAVSNADDYLSVAEIERATGWRYMQPECTGNLPGPLNQVSCTYTMQNAWSQALGVGPFTGSNFRFVIADGQIEQVLHIFRFSTFDPQVYTVFQDWLIATHPNDVGVMYDSDSANFNLTPEAIALFEQHTTEFVSSVNNPESD